MSASLAVVAVGNSSKVRLGQDGAVLSPVRLRIGYGSKLESDWDSIGRDSGRGDAVLGRFVSDAAKGDSVYSASMCSVAGVDGSVIAKYLLWRATCGSNGRFVNYYA